MRSIIVAGSLVGVLVVMAAFMNLNNQKTLKKMENTENTKGFAVVELFTSEGCSSCPPADELVEKIQKTIKNEQLYVLAYHVDYWDHQGWKDTFSDAEYSKRQRQYASWLNLRTIYTPQIVVNGTNEFVGSDQGALLQAISGGLDHQEGTKSLTVKGKIENNRINIDYQAAGEEKNTELVLALVQKSGHSNVKAGENSGRSLSHVQIVRQTLHFPLGVNSNKALTMTLPQDFKGKGWELIGFVQDKSNGHITAASRFPIETGAASAN